MKGLLKSAKKFLVHEEALELSEYALMLGLLAIALIAAIGVLSGAIGGRFNSAAALINS